MSVMVSLREKRRLRIAVIERIWSLLWGKRKKKEKQVRIEVTYEVEVGNHGDKALGKVADEVEDEEEVSKSSVLVFANEATREHRVCGDPDDPGSLVVDCGWRRHIYWILHDRTHHRGHELGGDLDLRPKSERTKGGGMEVVSLT